jgi:hypothetical protein
MEEHLGTSKLTTNTCTASLFGIRFFAPTDDILLQADMSIAVSRWTSSRYLLGGLLETNPSCDRIE